MWQLPPFFPRKERHFAGFPIGTGVNYCWPVTSYFLSFLTERCGNPAPPSGSSPPVPHSIQSAPNEDGDIQTERRRKIKHNQPFPSKKTDTKQNRKKGFESPYKSPCHLVSGKQLRTILFRAFSFFHFVGNHQSCGSVKKSLTAFVTRAE